MNIKETLERYPASQYTSGEVSIKASLTFPKKDPTRQDSWLAGAHERDLKFFQEYAQDFDKRLGRLRLTEAVQRVLKDASRRTAST